MDETTRDSPNLLAESAKIRIEKSAMLLFGQKGFSATSVREIVDAAGVTKPTLYYYFRDKNHLYESLFYDTIQEFYSSLDRQVFGDQPLRNRLIRLIEAHFESAMSNPLAVRFMFRAIFAAGAETPFIDLAALSEKNIHMIRKLFSQAAAKGEIPESALNETSILQFMGVIHSYMMRLAIGIHDNLGRQRAQEIVGLFLDGLLHCATTETTSNIPQNSEEE